MHLDRLNEELIYNTYGKQELQKKKQKKSSVVINTSDDIQNKEDK